jgi:hypothetical protein
MRYLSCVNLWDVTDADGREGKDEFAVIVGFLNEWNRGIKNLS